MLTHIAKDFVVFFSHVCTVEYMYMDIAFRTENPVLYEAEIQVYLYMFLFAYGMVISIFPLTETEEESQKAEENETKLEG